MAKRPLHITALRNGNRADVRIEGVVASWEKANARELGAAIDSLVASGVRDAHVFIDSEGGSVLEARRIAQALRKFPGRITGEGGAAVLSAATYLGLKLDEFRVRKDTAYMIHKPQASVVGNEDELKAELKALGDITNDYRSLYAAKAGKSEDEVEAIWSKGDKWYTGAEAVAEGFVDGLVEEGDEDEAEQDDDLYSEEAVARIAACGCPKDKLPKARAAIKPSEMKIEAMRALLGMPESATEAEVMARVEALRKENDRHVAASVALRQAEVKGILDKAIAEKRLTEAHRASYEAKFTASFDATKAEVEALAAAPSVAKEVRESGAAGAAAGTPKGREAWTFAMWAEKDEKGLRAMMAQEPERFTALYEDHYGKKPVMA